MCVVVFSATYHKTDFPEPAVVTGPTVSDTTINRISIGHTNSIEPEEGVQVALPALEVLSVDKPHARCRLSFLTGVMVI